MPIGETYIGIQCLNCGRFCGNVEATINGFDEIVKVEGDCKRCGHVDLTRSNWGYEDFETENGEQ